MTKASSTSTEHSQLAAEIYRQTVLQLDFLTCWQPLWADGLPKLLPWSDRRTAEISHGYLKLSCISSHSMFCCAPGMRSSPTTWFLQPWPPCELLAVLRAMERHQVLVLYCGKWSRILGRSFVALACRTACPALQRYVSKLPVRKATSKIQKGYGSKLGYPNMDGELLLADLTTKIDETMWFLNVSDLPAPSSRPWRWHR